LPNFPIIPLISAVHPSISTVHIPLKTRLLRYLAIPFSPRSAQPANPEPPSPPGAASYRNLPLPASAVVQSQRNPMQD